MSAFSCTYCSRLISPGISLIEDIPRALAGQVEFPVSTVGIAPVSDALEDQQDEAKS
jgi:hypothetical protein